MATVDITELTDAALDVVLSVRSGEEFVDAGHLTLAERYQVAQALGWEMDARTRNWVQDARPDDKAQSHRGGPDYEALILQRQIDDNDF